MRITRFGTTRRAGLWLGLMLGIIGGPRDVHAARVKLTDGTEVTGTVVERDGQSIILRLPRASVALVDGKPLPPPVVAGSPAPAFSVVDLSGTTQTLGSAKGEATLLQFWASWCPHCRRDVELLKSAFTKYQGKGVRIVTVSVDQDQKALATFLRGEPLPYPVVAAYSKPNTPESRLPDLYETQGIPAYVFVDARGTIADTVAGSMAESRVDLDGLLKGLLPPSGEAPGTSPTHQP